MRRYLPIVFALAFIAVLGLVSYKQDAARSAALAAASAKAETLDAGAADSEVVDAAVEDVDIAEPADSPAFGADAAVPPLPSTAPTSVRIGVILFTYQGAQAAPRSAPTKEEAKAEAERVLSLAQADFEDSLKHGDPGSTKDAGRIPRGVLEKQVEYVVFTLEKGELHSEPLDTPRGFWIVKRTD